MNKYQFPALVLLSLLPFSWGIYKYSQDISESDLNLHLYFLASDELEGIKNGDINTAINGQKTEVFIIQL